MTTAIFYAEAPAEFVVNLLIGGGIGASGIACENGRVRFSVCEKDIVRTQEILRRANVEYRFSRKGIKVAGKRLSGRWGWIAGIAVALIAVVLYTSSILKIEVRGNNIVPSEAVIAAAQAHWKKGVGGSYDADGMSRAIESVEGISFANVRRVGTKLIVEVLEELPKVDIEDTQTPVPVVSARDGIVTAVIAERGTPLVKIGDTVRAGDVLIAPYLVDPEGNRIPCRAKGEVFGRVWYDKELLFSDTVVTQVRTGRTAEASAMFFPGLDYVPAAPFAHYETEVRTRVLGSVLPLYVVSYTFYETEEQIVPFDFEASREEIIERERLALIEQAGGVDDGRFWYLVKRLDKSTRLSIYYERTESLT